MASPGTLKTAYPFIKHIPAVLANAKAQAATARRFAGRKQRDTTKSKDKVFGLFFPARSEKQSAANIGWLPIWP